MAILYLIKFLVAFCSIVYELLLAQALSAFLENTVLRYSVTIGLYLFSIGIGSWYVGRLAGRGPARDPVVRLAKVEIVLTVLGGFGILAVYALGASSLARPLFSMCCHALIVTVGFVTGFELPLLIDMGKKATTAPENLLLAADYAGALFGSVLFAFFFFPVAGLIPSAFATACLNAIAGMFLVTQKNKVQGASRHTLSVLVCAQALLFLVVAACLASAGSIEQSVTNLYLQNR